MEHQKRKTVLKTILILVLLLPPILLMILYATGTTIDRNMYTEKYKDFYIHKFDYKALSLGFDFGTGNNAPRYTKIWFLPSQKEKLLNKIKEDVHDILSDIKVTSEHVTVDYEISDDFRDVIIYVDSIEMWRAYKARYETVFWAEIGHRIALYHELLESEVVPYYQHVVHFVCRDPESAQEPWSTPRDPYYPHYPVLPDYPWSLIYPDE